MKLVFLGYMDNPLRAATSLERVCRSIPAEECIIVSVNRLVNNLEKTTGLKIAYFADFLKETDYDYIDNYAFVFSKNWHSYLPFVKGMTEFKNIKLTTILQLELYVNLCTILKNMHAIINAIQKIAPSEIILISEDTSEAFEYIRSFLDSNFDLNVLNIKLGQDIGFISKQKRKAKQLTINIVAKLLDKAELLHLLSSKKHKNAILMDYKCEHIIANIEKDFRTMSYVMDSGLRPRLRFLKLKKPYFSFRETNIFLNNLREKNYYRRIDNVLKNIFERKGGLRYKNYDIYNVLRGAVEKIITTRFPIVKQYISVIHKFLESTQPKLILLRDSVRTWECALVLAAKKFNIPTLVIQQGAETLRHVYSQQHANSIALWGNQYVKWYGSSGTDMSKSKITGYPCHDDIYKNSHGRFDRYKNILRDLKADPEKETVVYLGNCMKYYPANTAYTTPDLSLLSLEITLNAFKEFKNAQLIVKLHPYYTRTEYQKFKKKVEGFSNVFLLENANIPDLFSGALAVISELFSSAIVDAFILKKPIIVYNFTKRKEIFYCGKKSATVEIRHPKELKYALHNILSAKTGRNSFLDGKFIEDFAYKIDGKSAERVKDFIKEMMEK